MKVSILGTGSWGLALGKVLHGNGHSVSFWTPSIAEAEYLAKKREYKDKLPGIMLPEEFKYSTDMATATEDAEMLVFVVPSQFIESTAQLLGKCRAPKKIPITVSATKGISERSLKRMSEVILAHVQWLSEEEIVVFSGPTHAEEVAREVYTAIVAASKNEYSAKVVQETFSNKSLRVYTSQDLIGVELCGSVKNVIAIAGGIVDGLGHGMGDNTKAALITRGIAEIRRLGEALGANPHTFSGLAGIGDLIVTCMSQHSRNRFVGEQIGKGKSLNEVLAHMKMVAEGVPTTRSTYALAQMSGVEMPIVNAIYETLFNNKNPKEAIDELMARELKAE
ncbi:MAG: NAD(P)-dependent glycerol-3-phosphate dehydrogenase [Fibromonadaceae bacterium]|jgi:glycerol-3-phosphate dehydrogenase (NAD(P)+)|nr:NAD(P)-dependent glycerol-3-phosphate dehydrogenase [Fibromonadaceae bacterium]